MEEVRCKLAIALEVNKGCSAFLKTYTYLEKIDNLV